MHEACRELRTTEGTMKTLQNAQSDTGQETEVTTGREVTHVH